jgi:hypothetical protein
MALTVTSDEWAMEVRAHQERIERRAPALIAAIDDAMSGVGRQTRRWLVAVRAACESGAGPMPDPAIAIAEEIGTQAPRLAAHLAVDTADRAALAERRVRFRAPR